MSIMDLLSGQMRGYRKAAKQARNEALKTFYSVHPPDGNRDWKDIEIVSLDFETTGLDTKRDQIISYGMVNISQGVIRLDTAHCRIVRINGELRGESATIHRITDDMSRSGIPFEEALEDILSRLSGNVMLAHFHPLELGFLQQACKSLYGDAFQVLTLDTMKIAEYILGARNHTIMSNDLRLYNLRQRFGLPRYRAHNAFYDALATAELFLALSYEVQPGGTLPLKALLDLT